MGEIFYGSSYSPEAPDIEEDEALYPDEETTIIDNLDTIPSADEAVDGTEDLTY